MRTPTISLFVVLLAAAGCSDVPDTTTSSYRETRWIEAKKDTAFVAYGGTSRVPKPDSLRFELKTSETLDDTLRLTLDIVRTSTSPDARAVVENFWYADTLYVWCGDGRGPDFPFSWVEKLDPADYSLFYVESLVIEAPSDKHIEFLGQMLP